MNHNLIAHRKMLKLTQTEMANKLGITLASYYKKETGKSDFTQTEMENIKVIVNEKYPELTTDQIFFRE